jgi:hypothetical protein
MNDTPVTDAFFYKKGCWSEDILAFCRRLERERDEARQQYDDLATEHVLAVNKLAEERDQALMDRANGDMATMTRNHYERLIKERDEAKADAARIADILSGLELRTTGELARLEQERNEAQKELSSIHRWIDKNHADGFIDSLTYLQNLERVTDSWYDRIDGIEADARRFVRERDEARGLLASEKITRDHIIKRGIEMQKERDEARKHLRDANRGAEINAHINQKFGQQIIDAREQIKELMYIGERAIALAEIDFENDKFGVVSELRDGLERIKEAAK